MYRFLFFTFWVIYNSLPLEEHVYAFVESWKGKKVKASFNLESFVLCHNIAKHKNISLMKLRRNAQLPYYSDFDVVIPFLVLFYFFTKKGMTNISFCPGIKKIYQFHTNLQFESLGNWIFTTLLYPRSVNLAVFIDFNLCRNTTFL